MALLIELTNRAYSNFSEMSFLHFVQNYSVQEHAKLMDNRVARSPE